MKHGKYFMKYSTHIAEKSLACHEAPMTSAVFRNTVKQRAFGSLELETCEEVQDLYIDGSKSQVDNLYFARCLKNA